MATMTDHKNRIVFDSDRDGRLKLAQQLSVLNMSAQQRKKLTYRIARDIRSLARRNIRMQKTVSGSPMAKRADTRNKRKMLRGLARDMKAYHYKNDTAEVTWLSKTAKVAYKHQHGYSTKGTASQSSKRQGPVNKGDKATRSQAKALLANGYRQPIRKKNGGTSTKRVSQRWIMQNLSMFQAGYVLSALINAEKKQAWSIKLPARPFLGTTDDQANNFRHQIAKEAIRKMQAKGAN